MFLVVVAALTVRSLGRAQEYGVDVSFPMQHFEISKDNQVLGPNKQEFYDSFLQGCRDYFGEESERCDECESGRIKLNAEQPARMKNFTSLGFAKLRLPENSLKLLTKFWEANKDRLEMEDWPVGNTFTNQWTITSSMAFIDLPDYEGGGPDLVNAIVNDVKPTLEEWTKVPDLELSSIYGVRSYPTGSVLAPHVDRGALISSAIINVAQDVDEPWPLEVIAHDGLAYNVSMDVGDLVLYESHSVIHGRPFPLKGRYFANVFVHFTPPGYAEEYGLVEEDEEVETDEL